jgi:protein O-mannosyl-transferase
MIRGWLVESFLAPRQTSPSRPNHWIYLGICLALAVATLAVYSQVRQFDFVNYDDPDYSTANPHLSAGLTVENAEWAFTSSYAANWIPLTWISHLLDRQLFGWNPGADHLENLALHVLSSLLLFLLLARMTHAVWPSAFVAFAFALHPLHIESVAWIAERKDVLGALFFLLTVWVYLNYVERPAAWRYLLLMVAFSCALLSKSMTVTLPFVLLLLDFWPLGRLTRAADDANAPTAARVVIEKIPLIALAIAASFITFLVQRGGGAVIADLLPLGVRIENALVSYVVYALKFFWPSNLAVFYPYAEIPAWQPILAALVLAAITVLVIVQRRARPYLEVGWFWYLGMLVPVIGLIQVGVQSRADRYTYLPIIGIAIMLAWGAADLVARLPALKPAMAAVAVALCASWMVLTWLDLQSWRNSVALFQHAVEATQDNYVAYSNLGAALRHDGRVDAAIPNFERALSIKPHFADAHNGLGEALLAEGRLEEASPHLAEAVRLDPQSASAHVNLGSALSKRGDSNAAADQYRIALQLDPNSAPAHSGLGVALAEQRRTAEALAQLYESIRIDPDYADAHYNLGRLLGLEGRSEEAITQFSETVRLQPGNPEAHYNLGIALATRERMKEAAAEFRKAIEAKPDFVNARFNYASALANLEEFDQAVAQFQEILKIAPDFKPARDSLAQAIALRNESAKSKPR